MSRKMVISMGKYDNLSDKELLELLLKKSPEALERFREADKADAQLLAFNLQELGSSKNESEPD